MFKKTDKKESPDNENSARPWIIGRNNRRNRGATSVKLTRKRGRGEKGEETGVSVGGLIKLGVAVIIFFLLINIVPYAKIECQTQTGDICKYDNDYQQIVNDTLNSSLRFKLFFSEAEIEDALEVKTTVADSQVDISPVNVLTAQIVERSPYALWRHKVDPLETLVVSKDGYVISAESDFLEEELAGLPTMRDDTELMPNPGDALVDPRITEYATLLNEDDTIDGYSLVYIDINDSPRQFEAVLRSDKDQKHLLTVKFTTVRDFSHQLLDLEMTMDYLQKKGTSFKYIDVRLESATAYR